MKPQLVTVGSQGWSELREQQTRKQRRRLLAVALAALTFAIGFWLGAL
jgi:hypothetical protein